MSSTNSNDEGGEYELQPVIPLSFYQHSSNHKFKVAPNPNDAQSFDGVDAVATTFDAADKDIKPYIVSAIRTLFPSPSYDGFERAALEAEIVPDDRIEQIKVLRAREQWDAVSIAIDDIQKLHPRLEKDKSAALKARELGSLGNDVELLEDVRSANVRARTVPFILQGLEELSDKLNESRFQLKALLEEIIPIDSQDSTGSSVISELLAKERELAYLSSSIRHSYSERSLKHMKEKTRPKEDEASAFLDGLFEHTKLRADLHEHYDLLERQYESVNPQRGSDVGEQTDVHLGGIKASDRMAPVSRLLSPLRKGIWDCRVASRGPEHPTNSRHKPYAELKLHPDSDVIGTLGIATSKQRQKKDLWKDSSSVSLADWSYDGQAGCMDLHLHARQLSNFERTLVQAWTQKYQQSQKTMTEEVLNTISQPKLMVSAGDGEERLHQLFWDMYQLQQFDEDLNCQLDVSWGELRKRYERESKELEASSKNLCNAIQSESDERRPLIKDFVDFWRSVNVPAPHIKLSTTRREIFDAKITGSDDCEEDIQEGESAIKTYLQNVGVQKRALNKRLGKYGCSLDQNPPDIGRHLLRDVRKEIDTISGSDESNDQETMSAPDTASIDKCSMPNSGSLGFKDGDYAADSFMATETGGDWQEVPMKDGRRRTRRPRPRRSPRGAEEDKQKPLTKWPPKPLPIEPVSKSYRDSSTGGGEASWTGGWCK